MIQVPPYQYPDPTDEDILEFWKRSSELGGTVAEEFGNLERRLYFSEVDAYMDISLGPSGRPIIGRGYGLNVLAQLKPQWSEVGPTEPMRVSAWDALRGVVRESVREAQAYESPAERRIAFSQAIQKAFGAEMGEHGEAVAAQYLPKGWRDIYTPPALALLGASYAAPVKSFEYLSEWYPGYIPTTPGVGGYMRLVPEVEFAQMNIPGGGRGGGGGKQTGRSMYEQLQMGQKPFVTMPWSQGTMRAQVFDVIFPLAGSVGVAEGVAGVPFGTLVRERRPAAPVPLVGWGQAELSQIAGFRAGSPIRHGAEAGIFLGVDPRMQIQFRDVHWAESVLANAYVNLPFSYQGTEWWASLPEERRQLFRFEGGVISGGGRVPALQYDIQHERRAEAGVALKNYGWKNLAYEMFMERELGGRRPDIFFEEAPKDWATAAYGVGAAYGMIKPGEGIWQVDPTGKITPNMPLIDRLAGKMASEVEWITREQKVPASMAGQYLMGEVPGVEVLGFEGGFARIKRTFPAYAGQMAQVTRMTYPAQRSVYGGEELDYIKRSNSTLYERIVEQGRPSTAHLEIMQSYWASRGAEVEQGQVLSYGDVRERFRRLAEAHPERGGFARALAETPIGHLPIWYEQAGVVLPSARSVVAMGQTDILGEDVTKYVNAWEGAALGAKYERYMNITAEMMTSPGFQKTAREINVPGVMGPGTIHGDVPEHMVLLGREQFYRFAREVYGFNPSERQLERLAETIRTRQVMSQVTRYPLSDPGVQTSVFLQLGLGFGKGAPVHIGPEAIAFSPYIAALQHGDVDEESYKVTSLAIRQNTRGRGLEMDMGGHIRVFNDWGAGGPTGLRARLYQVADDLKAGNRELYDIAEREVKKKFATYSFAGLAGEDVEIMRLGAIVRAMDSWENELYKHGTKEASVRDAFLAGPAEGIDIFIKEQILSKEPSFEESLKKQNMRYKEFMGRTYEALLRAVPYHARQLPEHLASQVLPIGRMSYQKALDTGHYDPTKPLGADVGDPLLSHGLSVYLEAFGSMSFLYGGGYAATITGSYAWDPLKQEFSAPWMKSVQTAISKAQYVTTLFAALSGSGEGSPEQFAVGLVGREDPAVQEAIRNVRGLARKYVDAGYSLENVLRSDEFQRGISQIYRAAGWETEADFLRSQGALPQALLTVMGSRTIEELGRGDERTQKKWLESQLEFFHVTGGQSLEEYSKAARAAQAEYEALAGKVGHIPGDIHDKALALASTFGITPPMVWHPWAQYRGTIHPSSAALSDYERFGNVLLERIGLRTTWGGKGTAYHEAVESSLRAAGGDRKFYMERAAQAINLRLADIGITRFGDLGFSGKPDVVEQTEKGINIFDIKTYDVTDLYKNPHQLVLYAQAMRYKFAERDKNGQIIRLADINQLAFVQAPTDTDPAIVSRMIRGELTNEDQAYIDRYNKGKAEGAMLRILSVEIPANLQEAAEKIIEHMIEQGSDVQDLIKYISPQEIVAHISKLVGRYTDWKEASKDLFERAVRNRGLGIERGGNLFSVLDIAMAATKEAPVSGLVALGDYYGMDLPKLGVKGAYVVDPRTFLSKFEDIQDRAFGMSEQEVEEELRLRGMPKGMERGGIITIRDLTSKERQELEGQWSIYTEMKSRLAHEAGHALYRNDTRIKQLANEQARQMAEEERNTGQQNAFLQSVRDVYQTDWEERAASELVANILQKRMGVAISDAERQALSPLEQAVLEAAGPADISRGAGTPSGGGGAEDEGTVFLQAGAPGGMAWQQMMMMMLPFIQQMMPQQFAGRTISWSPETVQVVSQMMLGNMGVLDQWDPIQQQGPIQGMRELEDVSRISTYLSKGGGKMSQEMLKYFNYFQGVASSTTLDVGRYGDYSVRQEALQNWIDLRQNRAPETLMKAWLDPEKQADFTKVLDLFTDKIKVSAEALKDHTKVIEDLTTHYKQLTPAQVAGLTQAGRDVGAILAMAGQAEEMGPAGQDWLRAQAPMIATAQRLQGAFQGMAEQQMAEVYGGLGRGGGVIAEMGRGIGQIFQRATGGFGLFQLRRMWGFAGAPAITAETVAAQQEMAAMGVTTAMYGAAAPGPVATGLMTIRAERERAQTAMGRGAWMAYGGIQRSLAGFGGEAAGILGPAASVGLMAGWLTQSTPVGFGASVLSALYGATNYMEAIGKDELETAWGYRPGASWLERQMAYGGAASQGLLPGMTPGLNYELSDKFVTGAIANAGWWLKTTATPGGWEKVREWEREKEQLGAALESGKFTGNPTTDAFILRNWSEQSTSFLGPTGLLDWARWWQSYGGGAAGTEQIPQELFEQLEMQGISREQIAAVATAIGAPTSAVSSVAQTLAAQPRSAATMRALEQYGVAAQAGWVSPQWLLQRAGQLTEMTAPQFARFQRLVSGDQYALSRYGAGAGLALPPMAQALAEQTLGAPAPWMVTMELDTGLPLYTTRGGGLAGIQTRTAQMGGLYGIQREQLRLGQLQSELQRGEQWSAWQLRHAAQTGEFDLNAPGQLGWGAVSAIARTGGYWALENQQRAADYAIQQARFDYQSFQRQQARNQLETGYMATTGRMLGAGGVVPEPLRAAIETTGGYWNIENQMIAAQRANQQAGFGFQAQSIALSEAIFGTQQAHFAENWQVQWGRLQVQKGWQEREFAKARERNAAEDTMWMARWTYQQEGAERHYGWQMEDINEAIRYATGREKRQLMRQRDRTTEDYSASKGMAEKEKDYWEQQKEWRDEDQADAEEKHKIQQQWAEEDMQRSKRQHNELAGLQSQQFAIQKARLQEEMAFAQKMNILSDQKRVLDHAIYEAQANADKEALSQADILATQEKTYWQESWDRAEDKIELDREVWKEQDEHDKQQLIMYGAIATQQEKLASDQLLFVQAYNTLLGQQRVELEKIQRALDTVVLPPAEPEQIQSVGPEGPRYEHTGGPVVRHGGGPSNLQPGEILGILEEGEYVIPRGGSLVKREDERVVRLLAQIAQILAQMAADERWKTMIVTRDPGASRVKVANIIEGTYR